MDIPPAHSAVSLAGLVAVNFLLRDPFQCVAIVAPMAFRLWFPWPFSLASQARPSLLLGAFCILTPLGIARAFPTLAFLHHSTGFHRPLPWYRVLGGF